MSTRGSVDYLRPQETGSSDAFVWPGVDCEQRFAYSILKTEMDILKWFTKNDTDVKVGLLTMVIGQVYSVYVRRLCVHRLL